MAVDELCPSWQLVHKFGPTHGAILELTIVLQGLDDGSGIQFSLNNDKCHLAIPGRLSALQIPLECSVSPNPLLLRYNRNTQVLKVVLAVAGGTPSQPFTPAATNATATTASGITDSACEESIFNDEEGEDICLYVPNKDTPSSLPQQSKKKNKNKKSGGGGGSGAQNNDKTSNSSAQAPSSSSSSKQQHQEKTIKSHRDALREHLGPKTYKKLMDTYLTATVVVSIFSIIFCVSTFGMRPAEFSAVSLCPTWIPSFLCLPNIFYSIFLQWWWYRLWLGVTLANALGTILLNWTLENMILPLIFAPFVPSQLPACIQETKKGSNSTRTAPGASHQAEEEEEDEGGDEDGDDPTDAFVKSAPKDNGSKYSYSSLLKLLHWHKQYVHATQDAEYESITYTKKAHVGSIEAYYNEIAKISRKVQQVWMVSYATGGGRLWLATVTLYYLTKYSLKKELFRSNSSLERKIKMFFRKIGDVRYLFEIGLVRVVLHLMWGLLEVGYTQYACYWSSNNDSSMPTSSGSEGECPSTIASCGAVHNSTTAFYTGSDVELLFSILFHKYSLLGVVLFTPSMLYLSYMLSKVKPKHLPRWWWAVGPKSFMVKNCLNLAQICVIMAWIPATNWFTTYSLEFLLLYSLMAYDGSLFSIPYAAKTAIFLGEYGSALSPLSPLVILILYSAVKIAWWYLVWQPWLPATLLALVFSTSSTLQNKVLPFLLQYQFSQKVISLVEIELEGYSKKLYKLLPLTAYLLGGTWMSTIAVLMPVTALIGFPSRTAPDDTRQHEFNKKFSYFTSMLTNLLWGLVRLIKTGILGCEEDSLMAVVLGFVIIWCLLTLTPLGSLLEKFINWIPLPSIDALFANFAARGGGHARKPPGRHAGGFNTAGSAGGHEHPATGAAPAAAGSSFPSPPSSCETIPPMMESIAIPTGASPMVCSILAATNHYSVLGMTTTTATDAELRKAKRILSLATHPDKAGQAPGAVDACQRVLQAADVLLDPQKRKEYDEEVALARFAASGAAAELEEELADMIFEQTGVDITQKDYIMVACDYCALAAHQAPVVPNRTAEAARYCEQHKTRHAVAEQESWVEKEFAWDGWLPGSVFRYYMCHQGKVYDCTSAAECAGLLQVWARSGIQANTHENYYHKLNSSRGGAGGGGGGGGTSGAARGNKGGGGPRGRSAAAAGNTGSAGGSGAGTKTKKKGKKGRR